jgi:hypothetical protein
MPHTQFGKRARLSFIFEKLRTQIAVYPDLIHMQGIDLDYANKFISILEIW